MKWKRPYVMRASRKLRGAYMLGIAWGCIP
jgi:hypothetical protein